MQQKLFIYSELMNGKYHTLRDTVLQKLCNNFTRFVYKHGDKLHDGETPHSFRVGLPTTLRLLGCSQQQVAQYIGWKSGEMAQHYSRSSDAAASLTIFEEVLPSASGLVTVPVSHPDNLQPICTN